MTTGAEPSTTSRYRAVPAARRAACRDQGGAPRPDSVGSIASVTGDRGDWQLGHLLQMSRRVTASPTRPIWSTDNCLVLRLLITEGMKHDK